MARHPHETEFLLHLGATLKRIRQSKGMSQYKLGMETMTDASYIRKIERGKQNITVLSLLAIANALGVAMVELVETPTK